MASTSRSVMVVESQGHDWVVVSFLRKKVFLEGCFLTSLDSWSSVHHTALLLSHAVGTLLVISWVGVWGRR